MPRDYTNEEAEIILRGIKNQAEGDAIYPEDILNAAAENPDHPLHDFFEWDDPTAAWQHRLDAVDALIWGVLTTDEETGKPMPMFVRRREE